LLKVIQPVFLSVSKVYEDPFPLVFKTKDDVNRIAPKPIEEALNPTFAFPTDDDDDNGFDISGCFYDDDRIDIERYFFD
jgi:hypothetical protein